MCMDLLVTILLLLFQRERRKNDNKEINSLNHIKNTILPCKVYTAYASETNRQIPDPFLFSSPIIKDNSISVLPQVRRRLFS